MALCKIQTLKINTAASFVFICFSAMAVLLASGGVYHGVETSKLLNYANTTCLIEQNSFQSYTCVRFYIRYACHAPFWVVHYKDYRAIVEGMTRYKSISTALTEANTYKVSNFKIKLKFSINSFIFSICYS
jgi:hypothetical protein